MSNAGYAGPLSGSMRLFDLRDAAGTQDRSLGARPYTDPDDRRLVTHPEADRIFIEQYRHLGAALHHAQVQDGVRSLVVTSAVGSEGKTLSATNLALMLSRSFKRRVLLVDGDLRNPSVHQLLQIENGAGLTDVLKRSGEPLPVHTVPPGLSVLTAGQHDPDPVSLLVADAAGRFFAGARDRFDWVIVDTPPLVLFPDAELLADRVDACVMVVSAPTTSPQVAARALGALGASRTLGIVLNRAQPAEVAAGYGYGRYGYAQGGGARRRFAWWSSKRS